MFRKVFKRDIVSLGIIQPLQRHWLLQWELIFFNTICDKEWIKNQARSIIVKRWAMYKNEKPEDTFWGVRGRKPPASRRVGGLLSTSEIKISPFFGRFLMLQSICISLKDGGSFQPDPCPDLSRYPEAETPALGARNKCPSQMLLFKVTSKNPSSPWPAQVTSLQTCF